jgi:hypothetical protein
MRWPEFFLFNEQTRRVYRGIIAPVLKLLVRLHIHPNAVTTAGFVLSIAAGSSTAPGTSTSGAGPWRWPEPATYWTASSPG